VWPYTNDEAAWLTPRAAAPRTKRCADNDNDPAQRKPPRPAPETTPPARKPGAET